MKRFRKCSGGFALMLAGQLLGALLIGIFALMADVGSDYSSYAWGCALVFAAVSIGCWLLWFGIFCRKLDQAINPGPVKGPVWPFGAAAVAMILMAVVFGLLSGEAIGSLAIGAILAMIPDLAALYFGMQQGAARYTA